MILLKKIYGLTDSTGKRFIRNNLFYRFIKYIMYMEKLIIWR